MLAEAGHGSVLSFGFNTMCGVAVALAPPSHGEISDSVVVGLKDLWVSENLVSKSVEPLQGYSYIRG